jgi:hypothetical protein
MVTIVCYEDHLVSASSPLASAFATWEKDGLAQVKLYMALQENEVGRFASNYIRKQGASITPEGLAWLRRGFTVLGKQARIEARLKAQEVLPVDERMWWLQQTLDIAMLSGKSELGPDQLAQCSPTIFDSVSPFEIADAISLNSRDKSLALLKIYSDGGGDMFSLLAALRWRSKSEPRSLLMRQLSEVELILKNFPVDGSWLLDMVACRKGRKEVFVCDPHQLWLAHLQRS